MNHSLKNQDAHRRLARGANAVELTSETTKAIRKATRCRVIEIPEREGEMNELLSDDDTDVGDWWPLKAGMVIESVVGLIELDLYLYTKSHSLRGNKTVWIFDDGKTQHIYTNESDVPSELVRAVAIARGRLS